MILSVIIPVYNEEKTILQILEKIKKNTSNVFKYEIIVIDDGSIDESYNLFDSFSLKYNKICKKFVKNMGRVHVTQEGINLATGDWLLFVRSNEECTKNIINEYLNVIKKFNAIAFMGVVQYSSVDKIFEKYLNNSKRGISQYSRGQNIHYKYRSNISIISYTYFIAVFT